MCRISHQSIFMRLPFRADWQQLLKEHVSVSTCRFVAEEGELKCCNAHSTKSAIASHVMVRHFTRPSIVYSRNGGNSEPRQKRFTEFWCIITLIDACKRWCRVGELQAQEVWFEKVEDEALFNLSVSVLAKRCHSKAEWSRSRGLTYVSHFLARARGTPLP